MSDRPVHNRDQFLDILKGFAIITVILGHTLQGTSPNFDELLPFRIVYAFHMPMFVFVSGMVAAIPFARRLEVGAPPAVYLTGLGRSALRLLVPFFAWAVVSFYVQQSTVRNLGEWLLLAVRQPDNVLWFLWVVFQCQVVLAAVGMILARLGASPRKSAWILPAAMAVAWLLTSWLGARLAPASSTYLTRLLLPYFLAGVLFAIWLPRGLPKLPAIGAVVVFILLVPLWHRTELPAFVSGLPEIVSPRHYRSAFDYLVGFAGTLSFVEAVRAFSRHASDRLRQASAFVGRRSLDVYALHFYALGWFPPLIAPLGFALAVSALLRSNPVTSRLFLGEWRGNESPPVKCSSLSRTDASP